MGGRKEIMEAFETRICLKTVLKMGELIRRFFFLL